MKTTLHAHLNGLTSSVQPTPEQNMKKVKKPVTFRALLLKVTWTPGIEVDAVICAPTTANSSANTVTYTLNSTDISSGSATITGLDTGNQLQSYIEVR